MEHFTKDYINNTDLEAIGDETGMSMRQRRAQPQKTGNLPMWVNSNYHPADFDQNIAANNGHGLDWQYVVKARCTRINVTSSLLPVIQVLRAANGVSLLPPLQTSTHKNVEPARYQ